LKSIRSVLDFEGGIIGRTRQTKIVVVWAAIRQANTASEITTSSK